MELKEKAALKTSIQAEIEKLAGEMERLREQVKPVAPDNAIGRLTRMEAINARNMAQANLRNAQARTKRLEQALKRMEEDPDFGVCVDCERPIPMKRLLLAPESVRCVRCLSR